MFVSKLDWTIYRLKYRHGHVFACLFHDFEWNLVLVRSLIVISVFKCSGMIQFQYSREQYEG